MLTDKQITEEKRRKQIAIIKASNELIKQTKEKMMMSDKISDLEKVERAKQMDDAIGENFDKARSYLGANSEEVESAEFKTADPFYQKKYEERLKLRGMTDEQMHNKTYTTSVQVSTKNGIPLKRRKHKFAKNEEDIIDTPTVEEETISRVENEEELMKSSMANNGNDLNKISARHEKEVEQGMKGLLEKNLKNKKVVANETNTGRTMKNVEESNIDTVKRVILDIPETKEEETKKQTRSKVVAKATKRAELEKKEEETYVDDTETEKITNIVNSEEYKFDFNSIPSYVQYDVIPLPSKGECYPHKKGKIPVAYLTASDENIIASPNMYRDGKIIDVILKRKVLDTTIDVDSLCKGDRDAVVLWLRSTGYGTDFPITVTNPNDTNKKYDMSVDLRQFDYLPFKLKGDENGWFKWISSNGDVIKFKYLSDSDEKKLRDDLFAEATDVDCAGILLNSDEIAKHIKGTNNITDEKKEDLMSCVDDIRELMKDVDANVSKSEDELFFDSVTLQMIMHTMSINGNTDREYIKNYIENMRAKDANAYRTYIADNKPGVDFSMTVNIPESDGGGSFDTFLRLDDYVFVNI